jgi:hypothetical protein
VKNAEQGIVNISQSDILNLGGERIQVRQAAAIAKLAATSQLAGGVFQNRTVPAERCSHLVRVYAISTGRGERPCGKCPMAASAALMSAEFRMQQPRHGGI